MAHAAQVVRRKSWSTAGDLIKSFKFRAGLQSDKISILNAVWEKEMGHFSHHWTLVGVRQGILYVKPHSSAAAQELKMRSGTIIGGLNKYFGRAWIKAIKISMK